MWVPIPAARASAVLLLLAVGADAAHDPPKQHAEDDMICGAVVGKHRRKFSPSQT
jgi:hypothetical protein